jgi:hypothetical protein
MNIRKLFYILLLLGWHHVDAQKRAKPPKVIQQAYRHTSIGLGGGSSHYLGETALYKYPIEALSTQVRWNGTVDYTRYISPWLSTRLAFSYVRIAGSDYDFGKKNLTNFDFANNYVRNLHFRNDIKELSLVSILNIVEQNNRGYLKRDRLIPYLFVGVSAFHHDPKARGFSPKVTVGGGVDEYIYSFVERETTWTKLRVIGSEGQSVNGTPRLATDVYPSKSSIISFSLPLGAGLRVKVSSKMDLAFEAGINPTITDYLDDIGGNYANPLDFPGNDQQYPVAPLPDAADFYPLTRERLFANPSRVPVDGFGGRYRQQDLDNIDITFQESSPKLSRERNYSSNGKRGDNIPIDTFLTFRVKLNYIIGKKIVCP